MDSCLKRLVITKTIMYIGTGTYIVIGLSATTYSDSPTEIFLIPLKCFLRIVKIILL